MISRRKPACDGARLPAPSRRAILAATSASAIGIAKPVAAIAAVSSPAVAPVDCHEGTRRCANWLAIDTQIARLQTRWAKLESWLARNHDWFNLSPAEQQALPGAKELRDIDRLLEVLFDKREVLLETLPTIGLPDLASVIARLAVVERLIFADDEPEAHALIAGCRQDLVALSRRSGAA